MPGMDGFELAELMRGMIRLINDMVDVLRMRSGKLSLRPAPTELAGVLARIVSDFRLTLPL